MVTITTNNSSIIWNESEIKNISEKQIIELISKNNLGDFQIDEWPSEHTKPKRVISCLDAEINFWMEDNKLGEVQFGPLFSEDDSSILWPKL